MKNVFLEGAHRALDETVQIKKDPQVFLPKSNDPE